MTHLHNYIGQHEGLGGSTPSEACGIALGFGRLLGPSYSANEVKVVAKKIAERVGISTDLHTAIVRMTSGGH
ncbi:MAG: hypothetical protein ACJ70O_03280 [Nitrososphaera sp.]